jgi:hypothetical protein
MDYLVLGSNGFAQVGDPDYSAKNKIELRILLDFFKENYPIPEPFINMAYFSQKAFPHDFGTYHEIVLIYDDCKLSGWESSELESENDLFDQFWDWFNSAEVADMESVELTEKIREAYLKTIDLTKGEHLKLNRA